MTSDPDRIVKRLAKDVERKLGVGVHIARGPNWTEEYGDYVVTLTEYKAASVSKRFFQPRYWIAFLSGYGVSRLLIEIGEWLS